MREAAAGHIRLRIGYAWSAMGRHTTTFQRRWVAEHPDTELQLIRTNSATAGLAEGACDLAVIRTEPGQRRFRDAIVGLERRYCAMAADDPWAGRRSLRLAEISGRVLVIDRRTGTTTPDLWPPEARPAIQYTGDIDDWLTAITTGRYVGGHAGIHGDAVPPAGRGLPAAGGATPRPSPSAWCGGAMTRTRPPRRPSGCSPPCTAVRDRAPRQLARRYRSSRSPVSQRGHLRARGGQDGRAPARSRRW